MDESEDVAKLVAELTLDEKCQLGAAVIVRKR